MNGRYWTIASKNALSLALLIGIAFLAGSARSEEGASIDPRRVHGLVLLLPSGPLHIQIEITDRGRSLFAIREAYRKELIKALDVDGDGQIARTETMKHPLFVSGRRFTGNKFLEKLRARRGYTDRELQLAVDRAAGQYVAIRQDNGLVDQDLGVFNVLDEDGSGLIERVEMRSAASRIAARDTDFDKCVTFDEFIDAPAVSTDGVISTPEAPPSSVHSEMLRNASEPILAPRLVRKYDQDRDAHLSSEELNWSADRFGNLDTDGNGLLTVQELTGLTTMQPDLHLRVDLNPVLEDEASGNLEVVSTRDSLTLEGNRKNVVRFNRDSVAMSIGYRKRDPVREAETNALATFNIIDADSNGYIDREEITDHQRFERYLFDAMDADDDDRVFSEELLNYVKAYAEPATTSCRVTMFDLGSGYFQILDRNADGRISIRELRSAESSLLDASERSVINPSRLPKSFRIEIVRGGVGLFGRVERNEASSPTALLQDPIGPIWFQRMDRNSDGDLTWDEFLGPREEFHRIDTDQDALIDFQEAKAYHAAHHPEGDA